MEFFLQWLAIFIVMSIATIAPGPDFILTVRNSLVYSRRTAFFTALGITCGVCVHITYCIIGIAAVISQSIVAFTIIKYLGASYLLYIGVKSLRSKGITMHGGWKKQKTDIPWHKGFLMGFWTDLFNPKTTLFYLALFTQFIDADTTFSMKIAIGVTALICNIIWYNFVAMVLTDPRVKNRFLRFSSLIDRICGGLLIALGLRLAFTKI